jgi:hypothetical protein
MRGNANTGQCNERRRGWHGILALRDAGTRFANAPICDHEGCGIKAGLGGPILLFLGCDLTLREPTMMGVAIRIMQCSYGRYALM